MSDEELDPRRVFLARAHARYILVEAGEMGLAEAFDEIVLPACDCQRWPLAAQWERTHPHRPKWDRTKRNWVRR